MGILETVAAVFASTLILANPTAAGQLNNSRQLNLTADLSNLQLGAQEKTVGPHEIGAAEYVAPPPRKQAQKVAYPALAGNEAKIFIYDHESGNNPTRRNSAGCLGLGQACPGSKLLAVCPTLDYNCEDNYFTNYANSRYGGWQGAYIFWLNHRWW